MKTQQAKAIYRPILFSTPMVQAIQNGKKSQTRRIVKPQPTKQAAVELFLKEGPGSVDSRQLTEADLEMEDLLDNCPYGQVGDTLWVRETFVYREKHDRYYYRADHLESEPYAHNGWRPSIFMPRAACRIFLRITDVWVERLQNISEEHAKAEGVIPKTPLNTDAWHGEHRFAFSRLWNDINGSGSWEGNPWVWVVEFERVEKPAEW